MIDSTKEAITGYQSHPVPKNKWALFQIWEMLDYTEAVDQVDPVT